MNRFATTSKLHRRTRLPRVRQVALHVDEDSRD